MVGLVAAWAGLAAALVYAVILAVRRQVAGEKGALDRGERTLHIGGAAFLGLVPFAGRFEEAAAGVAAIFAVIAALALGVGATRAALRTGVGLGPALAVAAGVFVLAAAILGNSVS